MNPENLSEDSDTSDEDYNPETREDEAVSEIDSDGDPEEPLVEDDKKGCKRTKKTINEAKKKLKESPTLEESKAQQELKSELTEDEKKKKDEDLWADFMKDTGFQSKKLKSTDAISKSIVAKPENSKSVSRPPLRTGVKEKIKVTQIFEFAGEEVRIEKEVAIDSAEARLLNNSTPETTKSSNPRGGLSGIGSVLSQLGKKAKISTLEKSKLDWDRFKKDEKIEEEIQTHNKGKDGYLERQDFLERADVRRFEIEREIRSVQRSKRLNN